MRYTLTINGTPQTLDVPPQRTLLHALREDLGLMGPREACGVGVCGSCTVLIDGQPSSSCLLLVPQVVGRQVLTIEGLSQGGVLHPVQQAYLDQHAFQCSFCTPGFILATVALLQSNAQPSDDEIRDYLAGNLCRCGAYPEILAAVRSLAASSPSVQDLQE
jgi:aerobic-type carbon monoxide dehydrogenase small subunit (CoxS/CutS family)